ncbi:MAG: ABC transporter ATP-binding protein [Deferrisomatales bacterium]
MAMLELQDVDTYYGQIHALKGVSVTVEPGEIVTIIGANGAGKSTLLKTASGLLRPRHGAVRLEGEDITGMKPHLVVLKGLVQVPEGRRIFGQLTVAENLEMGAFTSRDAAKNRQNMERVLTLFPRLQERIRQVAGTMSGGEQQMLAMGRAMMANPRMLLLDEPSMGLAPVLVDAIFETIQKLHAAGTTILLVEQNARMALQVASRGYVLQSGAVILSDSADKLVDDPTVRRAYLGEH